MGNSMYPPPQQRPIPGRGIGNNQPPRPMYDQNRPPMNPPREPMQPYPPEPPYGRVPPYGPHVPVPGPNHNANYGKNMNIHPYPAGLYDQGEFSFVHTPFYRGEEVANVVRVESKVSSTLEIILYGASESDDAKVAMKLGNIYSIKYITRKGVIQTTGVLVDFKASQYSTIHQQTNDDGYYIVIDSSTSGYACQEKILISSIRSIVDVNYAQEQQRAANLFRLEIFESVKQARYEINRSNYIQVGQLVMVRDDDEYVLCTVVLNDMNRFDITPVNKHGQYWQTIDQSIRAKEDLRPDLNRNQSLTWGNITPEPPQEPKPEPVNHVGPDTGMYWGRIGD